MPMPPGGQGGILQARAPGKLDGGHPAAFELIKDKPALLPGSAHPAFGVHGHRQLRRRRSGSCNTPVCHRSHNYENYESYQNPPPVVLHRTVTYDSTEFDRVFEPTIAGLRECVAVSSLAIGGSTGPTWALLLSDIRQIVLESKKSPHGYWFFDRCQNAITKHLDVVTNLKCLIPTAN